jgi:alcohol dehydrogenase (cytochrome c)
MQRLVAALALAGLAGAAYAGPVTDSMLGAQAGESWLHTNGNYAGWRYSTLSQVNSATAKRLKVAWIMSPGGKNDAQATPSAHDGVVYVPQDNKVFAVEAGTGRVIWKYEHKLPDDWGGYNVGFITGKHRGLALAGNNVYFLSNDSKLHSIDMKTGKRGPEYEASAAQGFRQGQIHGYCTTVGPMAIAGGTVIVPMNATDTGGLPGYVLGVSAETGDVKWKANMIPVGDEPGADTWPSGSTEYGGAGPWIIGSWDPELKMYYTGTANAYEWNPKNRGGGELDNLGAASIVAVNTDDGKARALLRVPGDPWDYDVPQTPFVITLDGRKTVVQPNKTGFIHYLDAKTGAFIKATPFADKIDWIKGYGKDGRPVGQIALPKEGGDPITMWPSLLGGVNMYPNAYNPKTGNLYLAATNAGMKYGFEEIKVISNVRHFGAYQEFIWGNEVDMHNAKTGEVAQRAVRLAMRAACSPRRAT